MRKIHTIPVLVLTLLGAFTAGAADKGGKHSVTVRGFELVQKRGEVKIDFTLEIGKRAARTGHTLSIIPTLRGGDHSAALTPVVVRGRRAEILYKRRFIASPRTAGLAKGRFITARNGQSVKYEATVPFENWMAHSQLTLEGVNEGCCRAVSTTLGTIAENVIVPEDELTTRETHTVPGRALSTGEKLAEMFPFVKPASEMKGDGLLREGVTVYFHQSRHEIDPDYRDNRQKLIDILSVIDALVRSGETSLERVVIAGFASPEGHNDDNLRLSDRRAKAVTEFIQANTSLSVDRIKLHIGGEDWDGLRELVAASDMLDREAVLKVIDLVPVVGRDGKPGRETMLMNLEAGVPYRYMFKHFFPELREAAYIAVYYKDTPEGGSEGK